MADVVAQRILRKLAIVPRAVANVRDVIIAITLRVRVRILCQPSAQPLVNVPVRGIDSDMPHVVAVLSQQRAEPVPFFGSVALLQGRIAKQADKMASPADMRLVLQKVRRE